MKRDFGVVHGWAECQDCTWTSSSYKNIQAIASRHATAHGHRVVGEVGSLFTYDARDEKETGERHE